MRGGYKIIDLKYKKITDDKATSVKIDGIYKQIESSYKNIVFENVNIVESEEKIVEILQINPISYAIDSNFFVFTIIDDRLNGDYYILTIYNDDYITFTII